MKKRPGGLESHCLRWQPAGVPTITYRYASIYLQPGPNRIGRVYKKAVYLQYTNDSFTEEIKKPDWLGFLGPIMTAEVGDTLTVVLKNFASRPYSMHPHGVQYTKANEGALYPDDTLGAEKKDDSVQPGESYTYQWEVVPDQGPSAMDDNCVIRLYHSHVDSAADIYAGLVGALIICKKGGINNKERNKRYKEFILMFSVVDENSSWYLDENINTYCTDPASVDREDEDFIESNKMHSINGYMYGNLPGLSMCDNSQVVWYLFSTGNEVDIHSANFNGQVLSHQYFRVDTLNVFPASMIQATMSPKNPGKWLLSCKVADHWEAGIQAIYEVENCTGLYNCSTESNIRRYYIAAEEVIWNYAPTSINQFNGKQLDDPASDSATFFTQNQNRIGGSYKKVVYVEYKDATFTRKKERSKEEEHLGLLGPIIWAEVGDMIKVTFKNNASRPHSIQAHGVSYTKCMEGAVYKTGNASKANLTTTEHDEVSTHVKPGATFTYEWHIPYRVGPTLQDLNCIPWLYYSSVDVVRDPYSGLVGPLLVCSSLSKGKPTDVDHNFFIMANVIDENKSWYLDENIQLFTGNPQTVDKKDPDFQESNMRHSINGYMYGNQPGLETCKGDLVLWHMLGLGNEVDMHGIHFTGNTIQIRETTKDVASLFPHISYSVEMTPDNVGVFNVECLTADHYTAGMRQHYTVQSCDKKNSTFRYSRNVTYYIAAEEVDWDYSPNRTWEHLWNAGHKDINPGDVFLNRSQKTIGSKYKKAVYREYTDGTFTVRKERTKKQEHLALLGPLLLSNVGDRINIVFKNMASRLYSIYAHGVKPEDNDIKPTEPGQVQTYVWNVVKRSGPNRQEEYCLTWPYYSTVDRVKDIYSGLIGTLVVCKKGYFPFQMLATPVVRFAIFFMVCDENKSWYLDENIQKYCLNPEDVDKTDEDFIESNKMHSINGLMYGNLQLTMHVGDNINWHLIVLGNEVDIHTVHFHGHSFQYSKGEVYQTDVFETFPGTSQTVAMKVKNPGTWFLHCHVDDHMAAGMETVYTVLP